MELQTGDALHAAERPKKMHLMCTFTGRVSEGVGRGAEQLAVSEQDKNAQQTITLFNAPPSEHTSN